MSENITRIRDKVNNIRDELEWTDKVIAALEADAARVAELEAIVSKLPKFNDGSPIELGCDVFAIMRPSGLPAWVKAAGKVTQIRANGVDCRGKIGDWSFVESSDAYPTLEAANNAVSANTKSPCPVCGRAAALAAKEKRP